MSNFSSTALPPLAPFTIHPLIALVDPFVAWLASMPVNAYTAPPPGHKTGSIGGHARHALDHVRALLRGRESGVVDYDARERNVPEESDPAAVVESWRNVRAALLAVSHAQWAGPVVACAAQTCDGARVAHDSTLAREASFVFSHTVHHFAVVSLVAQFHGLAVPKGLGMAPSTAAYEKGCAPCAR